MKKLIFTRVLPLCIVLGAILIIGSGCPGSPSSTTPPPCDTTNSMFKQLYLAKLSSLAGAQDVNTMDLLTHEYTFSVNANKNICGIGYKALPAIGAASVPYTIEIVNATTSAVVYTGNHLFNGVNYVNITPVAITAGQQYKVKRTLTNNLGNIGNNIGRCLTATSFAAQLPLSHGGLTIHATNAYGQGGPVPNFGLPFIDIVFQ